VPDLAVRVEPFEMRNYLIYGFLFTAVLLFTAANSISSDRKLTSKQRTEASRLYNTRCIACHRLYDPIGYSDDEWKLWMARMSRKA
jgi:hypothetical protein